MSVDRGQSVVRISNPAPRMLTVDTYRVIRQLMLADAVAAGYRPFHTSAVVIDGRGVALVGEKGRGKTTISAQLCLGGAAHLANDKLLIGPGGHALHFPEAPAVMRSTIEVLGLADRYDSMRAGGRFDAGETFLDHPLPRPLVELDPQAKVMLSEREYVELLGCAGPAAADLAMVVELGVEDEVEGPVTEPMSRHWDDLEPFGDWLGVRPPFPAVDIGHVPVVRIPRAGGVRSTAARIRELVG